MDDWVDEKESLVPVSVSDEEKMENGDEQAGSSTGSEEKDKMARVNGEEIEESGTGTGIIESIASMIPGHSTDEGGGEHKEEDSASMSNGEEEENAGEGNGEMQDKNGEQISSASTGIIDSIASKFGVTVSGHSTKEEKQQQKADEGEHKDKDNGGTIHQPISGPPDSLPVSEEDVPAADEAILLISIIED